MSLESFNVSQRLPAVWTDVYGVLTVVDAERNEAATQQSAPTDTPHIRHRLLQTTDRAYAGAVKFGNNNTFLLFSYNMLDVVCHEQHWPRRS